MRAGADDSVNGTVVIAFPRELLLNVDRYTAGGRPIVAVTVIPGIGISDCEGIDNEPAVIEPAVVVAMPVILVALIPARMGGKCVRVVAMSGNNRIRVSAEGDI